MPQIMIANLFHIGVGKMVNIELYKRKKRLSYYKSKILTYTSI